MIPIKSSCDILTIIKLLTRPISVNKFIDMPSNKNRKRNVATTEKNRFASFVLSAVSDESPTGDCGSNDLKNDSFVVGRHSKMRNLLISNEN